MERIVNLTPHTVNIVNEAGATVATIAPSGFVARVATKSEKVRETESGIPLFATRYGQVTGLPEPEPDTIYIVSGMLLASVPHRTDVWQPGELLRDEAGRVVGCVGLSRPAWDE